MKQIPWVASNIEKNSNKIEYILHMRLLFGGDEEVLELISIIPTKTIVLCCIYKAILYTTCIT